MHEKLAAERRQAEAGPNLRTVDHHPADAGRQSLFPFREDRPSLAEQAQPEPDGCRSISGPIIRSHEPGGQPVRVPEEHVIIGEIQWVQIFARIGQHRHGQTRFVQRDDRHPRRVPGVSTRSRNLAPSKLATSRGAGLALALTR